MYDKYIYAFGYVYTNKFDVSKNCFTNNKVLYPVCGSDGILRLDKRKNIVNLNNDASIWCKKHNYDAYSIGYLSPIYDSLEEAIQTKTLINKGR